MATTTSSPPLSPRTEFGAQPPRMPYPTVPTNLPGVYSIGPFTTPDLRKATKTELLRQGFLISPPGPDAPAAVVRLWNRALSRPWTPENHIVPELQPHPGRTHLRLPGRQRGSQEEGFTFLTKSWSGVELARSDPNTGGQFSAVSSFWTVPTVDKPSEAHGPDGGWDSFSWIGIGGDLDNGATDLLQAGTAQKVNSSGHASYFAWYEWIDAFRRLTLDDQTPSTYGIASSAFTVILAYRGENDHIYTICSTDNGFSFANRLRSKETTSEGPALASWGNAFVVGWIGPNNNRLNVAQVDGGIDGNPPTGAISNKVELSWKSTSGPALAFVDGILYMAWKDTDNHISLAASADYGFTFSPQFQSIETTTKSPTLAVGVVEGVSRLYVGWRGEGNNFLNVATVLRAGNAPVGIIEKLVITTETTSENPALCALGPDLFLAFKDSTDDHLSVMVSHDQSKSFGNKVTSYERSPSGPSLGNVLDIKLLVGWRGESDHVDLCPVGLRGGVCPGFGEDPPYFPETAITNFAVHPGDEMVCTVLYSSDLASGSVFMGNVTTGKHFAITITPPFQAEMSGGCVEWIMEAPQANWKQTVLPAFTPVVFTDAIGCTVSGQVGDPLNGDELNIGEGTQQVTSVAVASKEVTIDFTG